jgi:eukaryotic-like serine/threonine-protein kinase
MIGQIISHYEILEKLGEGGMGVVYKAHDTKLDRTVALKFLPQKLTATDEDKQRFIRGAKAAAALNHPHICTIYSVEEHDGQQFISMEYIDGVMLRQKLETKNTKPETAIVYAIQIAEALQQAHKKDVVHRDIKPENIMVTEDDRIKVMDFGLAKLKGVENLTKSRSTVGTLGYMSPEQIEGSEVDHRSDIFSFGVVFYEMLTGRKPFRGEHEAAMVYSIVNEDPQPVQNYLPEAPPELVHILHRSLEKDPADRYQSIDDMLIDLKRLKKGSGQRPVSGIRDSRRTSSEYRLPQRILKPGIYAVPVILVLLIGLYFFLPERSAAPEFDGTIAVLPFQNLSADPAHAYFAGGLHDELLTQLAMVEALSVRGRTSVMGYAGTTKSIRDIARELNVAALVEGSVQVVGERLRVNVQLINAATDEHLWAERYDRTLDDAFEIQSDVAQRIVAAVGMALGSAERELIASVPTANPEAYRLFLQGLDYYRRPGFDRRNWEIAQELFERAIALDPGFALAYAELSEVHGRMHWLRYDTSPERVEKQRETAETALRLAPERPEVRMAMGTWHYWGRRDYAAALAEYEIALRGLPNDNRLREMIGHVHRRLGNWDEVYRAFEKSIELDPRNAQSFNDLGGSTFWLTRRYADAVRAYEQALSLAPDLHNATVGIGYTYAVWMGDLDPLRAALKQAPADHWLSQRLELLIWERQPDSLLAYLEAIPAKVLEDQLSFLPTSLYAAWAHKLSGDQTAANLAFDSARVLIDSVSVELPDDWRVRAARGLVYAGLGNRDEALREADWLKQSVIYREDANWWGWLAQLRAWILAYAGDIEEALDEVEQLLARPSRVSLHTLRLDPRWDPIREHPRFQELLEKYAEL